MNYLLCGQNAVTLDDLLSDLRNRLDPTSLSTTTIDVQSSSLAEIANACQAMPFFGGMRVVILRQPLGNQRRSDGDDDDDSETSSRVRWADLHALFKTTPASTSIVIRHDGAMAQNHYVRKALSGLGWHVHEAPVPVGADMLQWVSARAERSGVTIDSRAAQRLLDVLYPSVWEGRSRFDTVTPDMRVIATELEKLACAAENGAITAQTVETLVADRSGYKAFALNGAVFGGNVAQALKELDLVLEAGDPAERVIGQLSSEATALASARWSREYGAKSVAAASGTTEGRVAMLQRRATELDLAAMRQIADLLRRNDSGTKTGQTLEASATIVPLVAELAEVIQKHSGGQRRRN